jgi:hypothetical protein
MNIDELPDQLEAFFDRARTALDQQIVRARKVVDNLNAEKTAATKALADLKEQRESAKKQLEAVLHDLHRGSSLVGLNHEIAAARKTLEALKVETKPLGLVRSKSPRLTHAWSRSATKLDGR